MITDYLNTKQIYIYYIYLLYRVGFDDVEGRYICDL